MKLSIPLTTAGLVSLAYAVPQQNQNTCACPGVAAPSCTGGSTYTTTLHRTTTLTSTETVTLAHTATAVLSSGTLIFPTQAGTPSGYGPTNGAQSVTGAASASDSVAPVPTQVSSYVTTVYITLTQGNGQPSVSESLATVPTTIIPESASQPSDQGPTTITVIETIPYGPSGSPTVVTSETTVQAPSTRSFPLESSTYPVGSGANVPLPSSSVVSPVSGGSVSSGSAPPVPVGSPSIPPSPLPSGITVTGITSVYTTICPATSVISTSDTSSTITYETTSTITTTLESTITLSQTSSPTANSESAPGQTTSDMPSLTGTEVSPVETSPGPGFDTFTVTITQPAAAPSGTALPPSPSVYETTVVHTESHSVPGNAAPQVSTVTLTLSVTQSQLSTVMLPGGGQSVSQQEVYTVTQTQTRAAPPYGMGNSSLVGPTGTGPSAPVTPVSQSTLISYSTATVYSTSEVTVIGCADTVTNCPASSTIVSPTLIPVSTTLRTLTLTSGGPSGSPSVPIVPSSATPSFPDNTVLPTGPSGSGTMTPAFSSNSSLVSPIGTTSRPGSVVPSLVGSSFTPSVSPSVPSSTLSPITTSSNSGPLFTYAPSSGPSSSNSVSISSRPIPSFTFSPSMNSSIAGPTGASASLSATGSGSNQPSGSIIGTTGTGSAASLIPSLPLQSVSSDTSLSQSPSIPPYGSHTSSMGTSRTAGAVGITESSSSSTTGPVSGPPGYQTPSSSSSEASPAQTTPSGSSSSSISSVSESSIFITVTPVTPSSGASGTLTSVTCSPTQTGGSIPGYTGPSSAVSPVQTSASGAPGYASQPAAPRCTLAPAYGSALTNVTGELPAGSLSDVIPKASCDSVVVGLMGQIRSKVSAAITPQLRANATFPTGLPARYSHAGGSSVALQYEGGMTVANLLDWCAYLTVTTFADAGAVVAGTATGSAAGNLGIDGHMTFDVNANIGAGAGQDWGFGGTNGLHLYGSGGIGGEASAGVNKGRRGYARALRV